jgi:uncharacterized lipoprotein YddW (UPF0748 family)
MIWTLIQIVFYCTLSFSLETMEEEFRAVWIATVNNIDWPSSNTAAPAQQQQELIEILDTIQRLNMNAVIFQVIARDIFFCLLTSQDYL